MNSSTQPEADGSESPPLKIPTAAEFIPKKEPSESSASPGSFPQYEQSRARRSSPEVCLPFISELQMEIDGGAKLNDSTFSDSVEPPSTPTKFSDLGSWAANDRPSNHASFLPSPFSGRARSPRDTRSPSPKGTRFHPPKGARQSTRRTQRPQQLGNDYTAEPLIGKRGRPRGRPRGRSRAKRGQTRGSPPRKYSFDDWQLDIINRFIEKVNRQNAAGNTSAIEIERRHQRLFTNPFQIGDLVQQSSAREDSPSSKTVTDRQASEIERQFPGNILASRMGPETGRKEKEKAPRNEILMVEQNGRSVLEAPPSDLNWRPRRRLAPQLRLSIPDNQSSRSIPEDLSHDLTQPPSSQADKDVDHGATGNVILRHQANRVSMDGNLRLDPMRSNEGRRLGLLVSQENNGRKTFRIPADGPGDPPLEASTTYYDSTAREAE